MNIDKDSWKQHPEPSRPKWWPEKSDYWVYEEGKPNPHGPFDSLQEAEDFGKHLTGWVKITSTKR